MGDGVHTKILLIIAGISEYGDTHTYEYEQSTDVHHLFIWICSDVHLDAEQCVRCSSGGAPPRRSDS